MAIIQPPSEQNEEEAPKLKVACELSDCMYYNTYQKGSGFALCSHPDKKFHLRQGKCPLYRMDWEKKMEEFA